MNDSRITQCFQVLQCSYKVGVSTLVQRMSHLECLPAGVAASKRMRPLDRPVYTFGHVVQKICTLSFLQALEDVLDVLRGSRLMPVCHQFLRNCGGANVDVAW